MCSLKKLTLKIIINSKKQNYFLVLITSLALISIFTAIFLPINTKSTKYFYNANNESDINLVLIDQVPKKLEIDVLKKVNFEEELFISTSAEPQYNRALVISSADKDLIIEITQTDFREIVKLPIIYQSIKIKYTSNNNQLNIIIDSDKIHKFRLSNDQKPFVTGLHTLNKNDGVQITAEIETLDHQREVNIIKRLLLLVLLLFVFAVNFPIFKRLIKGIKLKLNFFDYIVVVLVTITGFVYPPGIDDGEMLTIQRNYENFGYASGNSNAYPLGQWWFWIYSFWSNNFTNIFYIRIPNLIFYLLTWFIIDRFIIKKIITNSELNKARLINLLIFSVFLFSWGGTLRYDSLAILLSSLIFALVYNYKKEIKEQILLIIFLFVSLSVTLSLSGWVNSLVFIPILYFIVFRE